jgi:hypothetical protein
MKTLTDLAESILELAKLPETTKQAIQSQFNTLNTQNAKVQNLENRLDVINTQIASIVNHPQQPKSKFEFTIEADVAGYADDSWEEIIKEGQALQASYRDKSEDFWTDRQGISPSGVGWFGSFESPKIVIKCVEPVYWFRNTARLPGSFQVKGSAHMGSILRFDASGDRILRDDNGWWHQTNVPVGLYVEPSTVVDGRAVRNFEQSISGITIVGQRGSMPIYIADNAFNFRLADCNIQAHQGARIVIKHGPALTADWYPVTQTPTGNNYLPDPIFSNCLIEGCHKWDRRNAGLCVSGNNIQFHGLNFYGVVTGIMSTGQGRTISACTMHHGATGDGRTWAMKDQLALAIMKHKPGENKDSIQLGMEFPIRVHDKGYKFDRDIAWYQTGEQII